MKKNKKFSKNYAKNNEISLKKQKKFKNFLQNSTPLKSRIARLLLQKSPTIQLLKNKSPHSTNENFFCKVSAFITKNLKKVRLKKMDEFKFDEAVMLGDASVEISKDEALFYQKYLGINLVSGDSEVETESK